MSLFKEKIAIVTGGGSGIGRAICNLLSERGAIVVVADINIKSAEETAASINTSGGIAKAKKVDVTSEKDVWNLVQEVKSDYKKLDYMFNNAGVTITGLFQHLETEHWQRIFNLNFWGVLYGTKAAYSVMVEQGFGHIINTSSAAGLLPTPLEIPYTASKFAVSGLSNALRMEGACMGIKVSVVYPGFIDTPIWDTTKVTSEKKEILIRLEELTKGVPLKKISPEKAAHYILRGVEKNKAYIVFPFHARLFWWLYRLYTPTSEFFLGRSVSTFLKSN